MRRSTDLVVLPTRPVHESPEQAHAAAMALGARCTECVMFGCGRGPVLGVVRGDVSLGAPAILDIVGEAPGDLEVVEGEPFVGPTGGVLTQALEAGGVSRNECTLTNTILCQPPDELSFDAYVGQIRANHRKAVRRWQKRWLTETEVGRIGGLSLGKCATVAESRWREAGSPAPAPPVAPMMPEEACRPRLHRELEASGGRVVLAVGAKALEACATFLGVETNREAQSREQAARRATARSAEGTEAPTAALPRYPAKRAAWRQLLTASGIDYPPDFVAADARYQAWREAGRGRGPKPLWGVGGELDEPVRELDGAKLSGTLEAFELLTRGVRRWSDRALVVAVGVLCQVPGLEGLRLPDFVTDALLEQEDQQSEDRQLRLAPQAAYAYADEGADADDTPAWVTEGGEGEGEGESSARPRVASLRRQHGAPVKLPDGRVLTCSYHPAFAMRDKREYASVIRENIARAAAIARAGGEIDWAEGPVILNPTLEVIRETFNRFLTSGAEVVIDIETDDVDPNECLLRCVGLGANVPRLDGQPGTEELIICVPVRHMDGTLWWSPDDTGVVCAYLQYVLDNLPLVFQNGNFDTAVLLRLGLMSNPRKLWTDTLFLHHDSFDNDLPHDLGFILRRYFPAPLWKEEIDHKSTDNVVDLKLYGYNVKDIRATLRVVQPLRASVEAAGTWPQYRTDQALAPVVRDMSELGLHCNEWKRGELSKHLNTQSEKYLRLFQSQVGKRINPRSVPQLQSLLYEDWGYLPITEQELKERAEAANAGEIREWPSTQRALAEADGEDAEAELGGTGHAALTGLQDLRIIDEKHKHHEAIETLLAFRAYDKLKGTYTDGLSTYDVDWDAYGFAGLQAVGWADAVRAGVYNSKKDIFEEREIIARRRGLTLVRTEFLLHVTPTGRLASRNPNFQNIPKLARGRLNLRELFCAPMGHVFVGADWEQLEARLYAVAAKDRLLLKAFADNLDIHSLNAASLRATGEDAIMAEYERIKYKIDEKERTYLRTVAKRFVFALIYGAMPDKIYHVMKAERSKATGERTFPFLDEKEVRRWFDLWHNSHPETHQWHELVHAAFEMTGMTGSPILDCRKRHFPDGASQPNAIPNACIQGSAAALANKALLEIDAAIPHRGWSPFSGLSCQVHDFIMATVPRYRAREAQGIIEKAMYWEWQGMPFPAKAEISWSLGQQ